MSKLYFAAVQHIEQAQGQAFNIGGGIKNGLSLLELFDLLENLLDINLEFNHLPVRESDQRVFIADITKANLILDWEPLVSAQQGVVKMVEWVSKNI